MLDFVFILLFPNDFLVFINVLFCYLFFWFIFEFCSFSSFGVSSIDNLFFSSFSIYFSILFFSFFSVNFFSVSYLF